MKVFQCCVMDDVAKNVPASSSRYLLNTESRSEQSKQQQHHQPISYLSQSGGVDDSGVPIPPNNNINIPVKLGNFGMMAPSTESKHMEPVTGTNALMAAIDADDQETKLKDPLEKEASTYKSATDRFFQSSHPPSHQTVENPIKLEPPTSSGARGEITEAEEAEYQQSSNLMYNQDFAALMFPELDESHDDFLNDLPISSRRRSSDSDSKEAPSMKKPRSF
ncbi:hypothetical protein L3Y34_001024 [Caenorhabditis briggsae]|uniref:Uncharacterized protein n=1 Tax=Caenorhabditis briggsae TaxID=6238 RepID=A0AAE9DAW1_CAEBR|nr:hypothetical protein L3Y34_001024 [Caenorhabditis briggsae]